MQTMGMPPELRDLFRRLLVVDPGDRPSASEVLVSEEYLALEKKALEYRGLKSKEQDILSHVYS